MSKYRAEVPGLGIVVFSKHDETLKIMGSKDVVLSPSKRAHFTDYTGGITNEWYIYKDQDNIYIVMASCPPPTACSYQFGVVNLRGKDPATAIVEALDMALNEAGMVPLKKVAEEEKWTFRL